jgi:hypothetical protein
VCRAIWDFKGKDKTEGKSQLRKDFFSVRLAHGGHNDHVDINEI